MHRRVWPTDLDRDRARAPPGPLAQLADPLLLDLGHATRGAVRAAGALLETRQRRPILRGRRPPAAHPLPRRRPRDVRPGRGLGERLAIVNDTTNNGFPTTRGEAGSMVRHFRASLRDVSSHPHPLARPGPIS